MISMENNEFKEENKNEENGSQDYAYKSILENNKNSRIWSVASLVAGILSVVFCFLPVLGIIIALFSVALAVISRRVIGYFDSIAIAGLVVGIFGLVFGVGYSIFDALLANISFLG